MLSSKALAIACICDIEMTRNSLTSQQTDCTVDSTLSGTSRLGYFIKVKANVRESGRRVWLRLATSAGDVIHDFRKVSIDSTIYSATVDLDGVVSSLHSDKQIFPGVKFGFQRVVICTTVGTGKTRNFTVTFGNLTRTAGPDSECLVFPRLFLPARGQFSLDDLKSLRKIQFNFVLDAEDEEVSESSELPWVMIVPLASAGLLALVATVCGVIGCHCSDHYSLRHLSHPQLTRARRSTRRSSPDLQKKQRFIRLLRDRLKPTHIFRLQSEKDEKCIEKGVKFLENASKSLEKEVKSQEKDAHYREKDMTSRRISRTNQEKGAKSNVSHDSNSKSSSSSRWSTGSSSSFYKSKTSS